MIVHGQSGDTVFLLEPEDDTEREWLDFNIGDDAMTWGDRIVVEHRYINDILAGLQGDGHTVKRSDQ